ncbi:Galactose oxidase/kelch repeat superfamily protein [Euphorbia peplus]|nr:Galactose oxidase/kelch repeat superfamily protein [Euphorbia peplus]
MSSAFQEEYVHEPIIPGLPDDLALRCLAMVSHGHHGLLQAVSKRWRDLIRSSDYVSYKAKEGWCGDWLFVLTDQSNNQWVAYDPEADRWHPLPKSSKHNAGLYHVGFSCVCVNKKLLVIGGSYAPNDLSLPHQKPLITDHVLQFDPFTNEWTSMARMQTPRSHFACSVMSGKVFVAGGRNLSCLRGLVLAEVYDPLEDRWEELPPMPNPQMDCLGLSYKGKFHILSDQVSLSEITSQVFDLSNKTWHIIEDIWPFSRAMQFSVQVMDDGRVYTVIDWGESLIKARDSENGEWYNVGALPPVILPNHTRALEAFGYGFATLKEELYILGGKVLKWEEAGNGRFDIVRLASVRICNPVVRPLNWKDAKPMCRPARGSVLGCASLEEECR